MAASDRALAAAVVQSWACGGRCCLRSSVSPETRSSSRLRAADASTNVTAFFVIPGRFVIDLRRSIKSGIQAIFRQLESFFDDESGVCVVDNVVSGDAIVLDCVLNQPTKKRDVCARTDL